MRAAAFPLVALAVVACAPTPRAAMRESPQSSSSSPSALPPLPPPVPPVIGDPIVVRSWPAREGGRSPIERFERSHRADPPPDEKAMEAEIDAVDLPACLTPSEKAFYWMHVAVLFDPAGTVRDVLVPPDAVGASVAICMKRKLAPIVVRPFAGSAVMILRSVRNQ